MREIFRVTLSIQPNTLSITKLHNRFEKVLNNIIRNKFSLCYKQLISNLN